MFGGFLHQVTFTAHDLGHTGVTGDYFRDRILGILLTNLIGGLSIGWWADVRQSLLHAYETDGKHRTTTFIIVRDSFCYDLAAENAHSRYQSS